MFAVRQKGRCLYLRLWGLLHVVRCHHQDHAGHQNFFLRAFCPAQRVCCLFSVGMYFKRVNAWVVFQCSSAICTAGSSDGRRQRFACTFSALQKQIQILGSQAACVLVFLICRSNMQWSLKHFCDPQFVSSVAHTRGFSFNLPGQEKVRDEKLTWSATQRYFC